MQSLILFNIQIVLQQTVNEHFGRGALLEGGYEPQTALKKQSFFFFF